MNNMEHASGDDEIKTSDSEEDTRANMRQPTRKKDEESEFYSKADNDDLRFLKNAFLQQTYQVPVRRYPCHFCHKYVANTSLSSKSPDCRLNRMRKANLDCADTVGTKASGAKITSSNTSRTTTCRRNSF